MSRKLPPLSLSPEQRQQIGQWLTAHGTPQQVAMRSRIVLAAADGQPETAIARRLGTHRKTVRLWRGRFAQHGLESLWEIAPGRGRKPTYGPERVKALVEATLQSKPKGMTHWSCRLMAKSQGVSKSTVSNIWRSHNLKPLHPSWVYWRQSYTSLCLFAIRTKRGKRRVRYLTKLSARVAGCVTPIRRSAAVTPAARLPQGSGPANDWQKAWPEADLYPLKAQRLD